jgi:hypothetical protein
MKTPPHIMVHKQDKREPRWLCGPDQIGHKKHSFMVITLENPESFKELIEHKTIFGWGHPMCIKECLDIKLNDNA